MGVSGAAYWLMLSSYSQALGRFPFRGFRPDDGRKADSGKAATHQKVIALTFDDGPNEPFTSQIADFLHEHGITATFFQVGRCVARFPDVPAALIEQGHVIGNHSYSHAMGRCVRPAAQRTETAVTQEILTRVTGRTPMLYRPPWLLRTPALFKTLRGHGLQAVSGEFAHAFEVFQPSARRIATRALAKARPGAILIFHDGFDSRGGDRAMTVAATKIVVGALLDQGYRFATVDDLLGIPAYRTAVESS
ncbi:peptidoglycan/xylan/chitin deacetylase (PgdA/CDA1 family) [Nakamurella sp. UYEF19]|uniref:polysaccharide deacetylase family protein n=1 Tax=Nakamurella sp. UYEF19 TaxID=1756392 RepID=UPI00339AD012